MDSETDHPKDYDFDAWRNNWLTLAEATKLGVEFAEFECTDETCRFVEQTGLIHIDAPDDVPLCQYRWRCAKCRGTRMQISLHKPVDPSAPKLRRPVGWA